MCVHGSPARFSFAAVLAGYYWASAMTKLEGVFSPTIGAYYQILPSVTEAADYDPGAISIFFTPIVLLGSWAEFILPALLLIGLFTRGAALAMIGFIFVQSLTDIGGMVSTPPPLAPGSTEARTRSS